MSAVAARHALAEERSLLGAPEDSRRFRSLALQKAVFGLADTMPEYSATVIATSGQKVVLGAAFASMLLLAAVWPRIAAQFLVGAMSVVFFASVALRALLAWLGLHRRPPEARQEDDGLPVYTVLIPLYREAAMVPQLAGALAALDYPADRLDIKFVVEENDPETCTACESTPYEVVVVPSGGPRTKPKACNYALQFARGEHVVVYDAEDRPEPDQLRKAAAAFRGNPDVDCFQAKLVIDNGKSGWLPAMFQLDYGIWFRTLLPGLDRLRAPIPLGGTSNHFRVSSLREAGAWDPFNVTEDADLGLRLARQGRRVSMLDSCTFEEAPARFGPWFRQRTRWMKGYMQTILVHTRRPGCLVKSLGLRGCLVIEAFLAGAVWSALVNPLLWVVFAVSSLAQPADGQLLDTLARASGITLLVTNVLLAMLAFADDRRLRFGVLPYALGFPAYWLLVSAAAYRALWQLIRDPFRWEKTPHGASVL